MSFEDAHSEAGLVAGSSGAAEAAYAVKLPIFEGPLDLLLHLIRQNEVEITDIPVALIAKQYLEYLELMRELNLEVAGEYLVMAASLALIKSRMLLPPDGDEDDEEAIDPRAELVARLLEYQRYKEVAEALDRRRRLGRDVFAVTSSGAERVPDADREIEVGLFELLESFRQVLQEARGPGEAHAVEAETVTVRERMEAIVEVLESVDSVEFMRLFEEGASVALVVATFLAILELARLSALRIYQGVSESGGPEGPIRLRRGEAVSEALLEQPLLVPA
jgi:segregation and condensation protein A